MTDIKPRNYENIKTTGFPNGARQTFISWQELVYIKLQLIIGAYLTPRCRTNQERVKNRRAKLNAIRTKKHIYQNYQGQRIHF